MILPIDHAVIADLDRVGSIIGTAGITDVPEHLLHTLADDAKQLGIRPVAASVLADPQSPTVVRERAFAVLAYGLIGAHARTPVVAASHS
jgi:hypothetical protein